MHGLNGLFLSELYPVCRQIHPRRVSSYKTYESELDFTSIEFLVTLKEIPKFKNQNDISNNGKNSIILQLLFIVQHR